MPRDRQAGTIELSLEAKTSTHPAAGGHRSSDAYPNLLRVASELPTRRDHMRIANVPTFPPLTQSCFLFQCSSSPPPIAKSATRLRSRRLPFTAERQHPGGVVGQGFGSLGSGTTQMEPGGLGISKRPVGPIRRQGWRPLHHRMRFPNGRTMGAMWAVRGFRVEAGQNQGTSSVWRHAGLGRLEKHCGWCLRCPSSVAHEPTYPPIIPAVPRA